MTSPDSSIFSELLAQDCVSFNSNEDQYIGALLGAPSFDPMELYFEPTLADFNVTGFPYFFDQHQVGADPSTSPGVLSSPSLPPSPFSSGDDLSDLGIGDAPSPYDPNLSPAGLAVLASQTNLEDVEPERVMFNTATRKWVCSKCDGDFVSAHEARRHVKTAAKCTGKKVKCLRCGDEIHAAQWSRKRHFGSKKCQKNGRKRGTPTYTVNNGFVEL